MREGLTNIRRVDIDIAGLAAGIGGRMRPAPLAVEELEIDRRSRDGDVKRRYVMHVKECRITRVDFHIHHPDLLMGQHEPVTRLFVHGYRRLSKCPGRIHEQEQDNGSCHVVTKFRVGRPAPRFSGLS